MSFNHGPETTVPLLQCTGAGDIATHPRTRSMRILRKKELAKKLSCSESTIDNRLNPSSPWYDETFPKPISLGAAGSRSSAKGWVEYVVDEWLEGRMEEARHMQ